MSKVKKGKIMCSAKSSIGYGRSIHSQTSSVGMQKQTKSLEKIAKDCKDMLKKRKEVLHCM